MPPRSPRPTDTQARDRVRSAPRRASLEDVLARSAARHRESLELLAEVERLVGRWSARRDGTSGARG